MDIEFVERFGEVLSLPLLKADPRLSQLALVKKGSRLSVMPVDEQQWQAVLNLRDALLTV